jgi:hypothetical protein
LSPRRADSAECQSHSNGDNAYLLFHFTLTFWRPADASSQ